MVKVAIQFLLPSNKSLLDVKGSAANLLQTVESTLISNFVFAKLFVHYFSTPLDLHKAQREDKRNSTVTCLVLPKQADLIYL